MAKIYKIYSCSPVLDIYCSWFGGDIISAIAVVAQLAAGKNVRIGRRLLNFGTLVTGCVVIYSCYLLLLWIGS